MVSIFEMKEMYKNAHIKDNFWRISLCTVSVKEIFTNKPVIIISNLFVGIEKIIEHFRGPSFQNAFR